MKATSILLLIISQGISLVFPQSSEGSVGYGSKCNQTFTCDEGKGLSCVNGTCQCILSNNAMIYEPETSSCLVMPHELCIVDDDSFGNISNLSGPAHRKFPCVKNAICDGTLKTCLCDQHFFKLNDTCTSKKVYNETCSNGHECREDLGLLCLQNDNVCGCEPDKTIYSKTNGCVGQAGKPCVSGMCTANARCSNIAAMEEAVTETFGIIFNSENLTLPEDEGRVCTCFGGYASTPSGSCAKDYGISCSEQRDCQSWLKCGQGGYCECAHPMTQFYDENAAMCVSKVGGPCSTTNFTLDLEQESAVCIVGAECVSGTEQDNNSFLTLPALIANQCRCKEGFEENEEGGCGLPFGSKCKNDDGTDSIVPCNRKSNLECVEGKCGCKLPQYYQYDKDEKVCVGRVGANCTIRAVMASSVISDNETGRGEINKPTESKHGAIGCIKGARCEELEKEKEIVYHEKQEFIEGVCKCVDKVKGCAETESPQVAYIIAVAGTIFGMAVLGSICYAFLKRQGHFINALNG